MPFSSKLLPPIRGAIRRFHGTRKDYAPQILEEGLKVNPPELYRGAGSLKDLPDYNGVYTTVQPHLGYFDPTYYGDALVVLDIPKDWYRTAERLPFNPEIPKPRPKPNRWDEILSDEDIEILDNYRAVVPVQQGGRVDIFKQDIPREFINEIIIPRGDDTFKTLVKPNRNLDWWNVDFGLDLD